MFILQIIVAAAFVAVPNQRCCHLHHLIGGVFCLPLIDHKFVLYACYEVVINYYSMLSTDNILVYYFKNL